MALAMTTVIASFFLFNEQHLRRWRRGEEDFDDLYNYNSQKNRARRLSSGDDGAVVAPLHIGRKRLSAVRQLAATTVYPGQSNDRQIRMQLTVVSVLSRNPIVLSLPSCARQV